MQKKITKPCKKDNTKKANTAKCLYGLRHVPCDD